MTMRMVVAAMLLAGVAVPAAAATPVATIEHFYATTLDIMKNAKALGFDGRAKRFEPAVREAFDVTEMTHFAVGPAWTGYSAAERSALTEAFTRMTAASYAQNFNGFGGEKFVVAPATVPRAADVVVKTEIVVPNGRPAQIDYRMRGSGSAWKAVDVYYQGGISQLSIRRSEFAATIASGGAAALVKKLDAMAATPKP